MKVHKYKCPDCGWAFALSPPIEFYPDDLKHICEYCGSIHFMQEVKKWKGN